MSWQGFGILFLIVSILLIAYLLVTDKKDDE